MKHVGGWIQGIGINFVYNLHVPLESGTQGQSPCFLKLIKQD